jgi:hypothetical protein
MKIVAEYIWQDGTKPTHKLRSKTKVLSAESWDGNFPDWTFDGSSTGQAPGDKSDCVLRPVKSIVDPTRNVDNAKCYLVLCEVLNSDGTPHETNTRSQLRAVDALVARLTANSPTALMLGKKAFRAMEDMTLTQCFEYAQLMIARASQTPSQCMRRDGWLCIASLRHRARPPLPSPASSSVSRSSTRSSWYEHPFFFNNVSPPRV